MDLFTFPPTFSWEAVPSDLQIRPLRRSDFNKGFCQVLSQLTVVGDVNQEQFELQFDTIKNEKASYIIVIEDLTKNKIIGSGCLALEKKFIHHCGTCGHIEDIVVDDTYRGKKLGLIIILQLTKMADYLGCYKLILDCSENNVKFYEKCGFKRKEIQMARYFEHNEIKKPKSSL